MINSTSFGSVVSAFKYSPPTSASVGVTMYNNIAKKGSDKSLIGFADIAIGSDCNMAMGLGVGSLKENSAVVCGIMGSAEFHELNSKTQIQHTKYPNASSCGVFGTYLGVAGSAVRGNSLYAGISGRAGAGYAKHLVQYDNKYNVLQEHANINWGVYLSGTVEAGIRFGKDKKNYIALFSDAAYATPASDPAFYRIAFGVKTSTL